MRFVPFALGVLLSCTSAFARAVPFEAPHGLQKKADSTKVGYLAVYWKTDVTGIFFALSDNDNPLAFTEINGGEPVFVPTVGQKIVRDVSIIPGSGEDVATKWYIVGTDLNINDYSSWDAASANGSKSLMIWDSTELTTWGNERLVAVENSTAGMVWAPDSIYDPNEGKYLVHWASKFFAESDTSHTGGAVTPAMIRYAYTTDFETFTTPNTYINHSPDDVIDLSFLKINDTAYVRMWAHDGVQAEVSYDGIFGTWEHVGSTITSYEGPYPFWSNTVDGQAYLIADLVGGSAGIRGFGPSDPATGEWTQDTAVDDTYMRHGSVLAVTQEQYDALKAL